MDKGSSKQQTQNLHFVSISIDTKLAIFCIYFNWYKKALLYLSLMVKDNISVHVPRDTKMVFLSIQLKTYTIVNLSSLYLQNYAQVKTND